MIGKLGCCHSRLANIALARIKTHVKSQLRYVTSGEEVYIVGEAAYIIEDLVVTLPVVVSKSDPEPIDTVKEKKKKLKKGYGALDAHRRKRGGSSPPAESPKTAGETKKSEEESKTGKGCKRSNLDIHKKKRR